jgi:hypothetical protein
MDDFKWQQPGIPHRGWRCLDVYDLGDVQQTCDMCQTAQIRYVHIMAHPNYDGTLEVGCVCAGHMLEDYVAPQRREAELKRQQRQRERQIARDIVQRQYLAELTQQAQREEEHRRLQKEAADTWVRGAERLLATDRLNSREREFIVDIRSKAMHPISFVISPKQTAWFRNIYLRVIGRPNQQPNAA